MVLFVNSASVLPFLIEALAPPSPHFQQHGAGKGGIPRATEKVRESTPSIVQFRSAHTQQYFLHSTPSFIVALDTLRSYAHEVHSKTSQGNVSNERVSSLHSWGDRFSEEMEKRDVGFAKWVVASCPGPLDGSNLAEARAVLRTWPGLQDTNWTYVDTPEKVHLFNSFGSIVTVDCLADPPHI